VTGESELPDVAAAARLPGGLPRPPEDREQDGGEDGEDGDDHQQLDEGKASVPV